MNARVNPKPGLAWLATLTLGAVAASVPAAAGEDVLRDKTLVAWVVPANLTQRGGSVLTVDDLRSCFDGIVFGELAERRWMAGSDMFRRTQRDQGSWPEEAADPETLVQVAIAYEGQAVTIYRDGKLWARYTMASSPHEFGPDSVGLGGRNPF